MAHPLVTNENGALVVGLLGGSVCGWRLGGGRSSGESVGELGGFFQSKVAGNQKVGVVFRVWVHVGDVILLCEFCVCRVAAWEIWL